MRAALLFLFLLAAPVAARPADLEETFARTAPLRGRAYGVGRDWLAARGDAVRDLLFFLRKERIFDGPALLVREHPDERVRKVAAAIRTR